MDLLPDEPRASTRGNASGYWLTRVIAAACVIGLIAAAIYVVVRYQAHQKQIADAQAVFQSWNVAVDEDKVTDDGFTASSDHSIRP